MTQYNLSSLKMKLSNIASSRDVGSSKIIQLILLSFVMIFLGCFFTFCIIKNEFHSPLLLLCTSPFYFGGVILMIASVNLIRSSSGNDLLKKDISESRFIIEEDLVYDKYAKHPAVNVFDKNDNLYLRCKLNGTVICDYADFNSINPGDIIYVVKSLSNDVICLFKKGTVIFSDDLKAYLKEHDYDYLTKLSSTSRINGQYEEDVKKGIRMYMLYGIILLISGLLGIFSFKSFRNANFPYLFYYYLVIGILFIIACCFINGNKKSYFILSFPFKIHITLPIIVSGIYVCLFIESNIPVSFLYVLLFFFAIVHILFLLMIIKAIDRNSRITIKKEPK